ncbi:hypothetical protein [Mycolicibacterium sediminis]|uniref:Uncharacterized protein n=1 Tax=Mycolicibacterium sediminis TaxID=1286180 RepID=A0A7I7QME0_9MYCO|nr:hypothetical protein [Mycolicibacterium sediminis]BBY27503.1 hypothetical protein MSEDJ_15990 [Mycolicibacterium sediminis]
MCGACGAGPHDEMGALISGPRRRAAIAAEAGRHARRHRIRVSGRAWTVSGSTGKVDVCRTFDDLVDVLGRTGLDRATLRSALLDAAGSVSRPS